MVTEKTIIKILTKLAINEEYKKYLDALKKTEDTLKTFGNWITREEKNKLYEIKNKIIDMFYVSITTAHPCVDCKEDNSLAKYQWNFSKNIRCSFCTSKKMDEIKKELN